MSVDEKDARSSDQHDSDEERSDTGESNKLGNVKRVASPSYDTPTSVTYHKRTDVTRTSGSDYARTNVDVLRTNVSSSGAYTSNGASFETTSETKITRSAAETERFLQSQGIDFCKNPTVIRRAISGQPVEYQQRVCLRYLHPPAPPQHGKLTIKQIIQPGPPGPPLLIRETPQTVSKSQGAIILRERPPQPPRAIPPETRTEYRTSGTPRRSVIIERYPSIEDKSRDIIIEKWLPYEAQREREVEYVRVEEPYPTPTCTVINYDNAEARYSRRFVVIDVLNANPYDYEARHGADLLDSRDLIQEARRAGVTEDITSVATLPSGLAVEKKRVDYRDSKYIECECFSSVVNASDPPTSVPRSSYVDNSAGFGVTTTTITERRSNYKSSTDGYSSRDGGCH